MTNKKRIVELSKHFDPIEVAEICNVSAGYVYRVLREHHPKTLTLTNYLNALQQGITNKEDLATLFGVARTTIFRFEQKHMAKETVGQILYILNGNIDEAKKAQALTNEETAELLQLPTLPKVTHELRQMLNKLEKHKNLTSFHTELYNKIAAALNALNC